MRWLTDWEKDGLKKRWFPLWKKDTYKAKEQADGFGPSWQEIQTV